MDLPTHEYINHDIIVTILIRPGAKTTTLMSHLHKADGPGIPEVRESHRVMSSILKIISTHW